MTLIIAPHKLLGLFLKTRVKVDAAELDRNISSHIDGDQEKALRLSLTGIFIYNVREQTSIFNILFLYLFSLLSFKLKLSQRAILLSVTTFIQMWMSGVFGRLRFSLNPQKIFIFALFAPSIKKNGVLQGIPRFLRVCVCVCVCVYTSMAAAPAVSPCGSTDPYLSIKAGSLRRSFPGLVTLD